jgi:penicillin-binding protein 1A
MIAGLPGGPSVYSPYDKPEVCLRRRSLVLNAMADMGSITREQAERAKRDSLVLKPKELRLNDAPYYVEEIRKHLEARYGANAIYQGAMTVHSTLDLGLQRIANQASENWLCKLEDQYGFRVKKRDFKPPKAESDIAKTPYLQGALVAMNPHTGHVLAMIGGRDYLVSKFNRAVQSRRQAGSSFKPFVYTAAVDNGFSPGDVFVDAPIVIEDDGSGNPWYPGNYDGKFEGPISLRKALALSKNLVAVKLIQRVGPTSVISYARKMGIRTPLPAVLSLALGSADVTLFDMVSAYGVMANRGVRVDPVMILKVMDKNGRVLEENKPYAEEVLTPQSAFMITNMLESVINGGTGFAARSMGFTRPAAGKTGTTNDYTDNWFVGFTPDLVCGVWVGFDQKKTIAKGATGAGLALPIWTEFMKLAAEGTPVANFHTPSNIVRAAICAESGLLATPACTNTRSEVFIKGNVPERTCDIHRVQDLGGQIKDYNFQQLDKGTMVHPEKL